ncbi:MAG: amidohydrolase family protein [Planctomycetes bacterium]|nr:amidohydrolase family protein [Planctomycetota bacterium]
MNRREFLAASATVAVTLPGLAKDAPKMIPIIDTHQHLWDLKVFKLGWLKEGSPIGNSYTPDVYAEAVKGLNVVKSVYMEVDVVPEQQQKEADYVLDLCKSGKTTMVAAVVSGRPASEGFEKYARQFKGSPYIKGVRQVIHVDSTPAGFCLKKEFIKGIQLLGDLGLSYDICIRPGELGDAAKLVDECPGTRFILDHCGNGPVKTDRTQWKKDMELLGKKKNLVCKVSGIVASADKDKWGPADLAPLVNHTIESFGWDRVMFGGDWPVCTLAASYKQWVDALKEIVKDRKDEEKLKLFHDNAAKFYGLS